MQQHRGPNRRRNMDLKVVADETKAELPDILAQIPDFDAMESSIHNLRDMVQLDAKECPGFTLPEDDAEAEKEGTRIRVFDMDTFEAALNIAPQYTASKHISIIDSTNFHTNNHTQNPDTPMKDTSQATFPNRHPKPVAVLNLASERHAGGGWQNGALAQEEALCYRSSLYLSLHKSYYPLPSLSAIYSPNVLIIRSAMSVGHALLTPSTSPQDLPVASVISVAALRRPALSEDSLRYKNEGQRAETKRKMRISLRVAAAKGHTKLVLGALGCGVFANPAGEVAKCFLEVLREREFSGGWWEDVVFAIMDNVKGDQGGKDGVGNYGVFYRALDGEIV